MARRRRVKRTNETVSVCLDGMPLIRFLTMETSMKEFVATLTSKSQITIPAEVRKHLAVKARGKVAFVVTDDGGAKLIAPNYPTVASLGGAAGSLPTPRPWHEAREIAREDALERKDPANL
jgi:bifunctional DNA-binding transcriptional regulator/antitoxin component of YhaV-PrlF toxin-antitoxin module